MRIYIHKLNFSLGISEGTASSLTDLLYISRRQHEVSRARGEEKESGILGAKNRCLGRLSPCSTRNRWVLRGSLISTLSFFVAYHLKTRYLAHIFSIKKKILPISKIFLRTSLRVRIIDAFILFIRGIFLNIFFHLHVALTWFYYLQFVIWNDFSKYIFFFNFFLFRMEFYFLNLWISAMRAIDDSYVASSINVIIVIVILPSLVRGTMPAV